MKRPRATWRVFTFSIAVVVLIVVGSAAWSIYRRTNPPVHIFAINPGAPLTEEAAVECTRRALMAEAKDKPDMRPLSKDDLA
jgi:hypothetical protein